MSVSSYGTVFYDFNCEAEPFNNVLVRKAFCLAIDRSSIINDVVQIPAEPAYSFIAPGYGLDGVDFVDGRSTFELGPTANVEAAQAALAEAGLSQWRGLPGNHAFLLHQRYREKDRGSAGRDAANQPEHQDQH